MPTRNVSNAELIRSQERTEKKIDDLSKKLDDFLALGLAIQMTNIERRVGALERFNSRFVMAIIASVVLGFMAALITQSVLK